LIDASKFNHAKIGTTILSILTDTKSEDAKPLHVDYFSKKQKWKKTFTREMLKSQEAPDGDIYALLEACKYFKACPLGSQTVIPLI